MSAGRRAKRHPGEFAAVQIERRDSAVWRLQDGSPLTDKLVPERQVASRGVLLSTNQERQIGSSKREALVSYRVLMTLTLWTAIFLSTAQAFDDSKYPNWKGAWIGGWTKRLPGVTGQPSYDPTKSAGLGQEG